MAAGFFDSVQLPNHNHSTTPGDGGQLSNITVTGTITLTTEPSAVLQAATTEYALAAAS